MLGAKSPVEELLEVKAVPASGITALRFHPRETGVLLSTHWDGHACLYDPHTGERTVRLQIDRPLLDGAFHERGSAFLGDLDGRLWFVDSEKPAKSVLATHRDAIRSVVVAPSHSSVLAGSWDGTVSMHDLNHGRKASVVLDCHGKAVCSMDAHEDRVVVATSDRQIFQFDLRNPRRPLSVRESALKYQTRMVRCFGGGFVCTSIEARVAVEYFDASVPKFAFKCHRSTDMERQDSAAGCITHSVNGCDVHPGRGDVIATAGSDGMVYTWDLQSKKRIRQVLSRPLPGGISAVTFSPDGGHIAMAMSECFERGAASLTAPHYGIYVKRLTESDIVFRPH